MLTSILDFSRNSALFYWTKTLSVVLLSVMIQKENAKTHQMMCVHKGIIVKSIYLQEIRF